MTTKQTRKEVLGGDLLQVVNADTNEHLGYTTNDIEIEIEEDEASAEVSTQRRRIRKRSYNEANLSVESLIGTDFDTFSETGITDPDDNHRVVFDANDRTWDEGALIRVYDGIDNLENAAEAEPQQVVKCETVEWQSEGIDYSDDFASATLSAMIHGDIYLDHVETTT